MIDSDDGARVKFKPVAVRSKYKIMQHAQILVTKDGLAVYDKVSDKIFAV